MASEQGGRAAVVGARVGRAIAETVRAEAGMSREWTGIDAQDADQFAAAGIAFGSAEWAEAEAAAEEEYTRLMAGK